MKDGSTFLFYTNYTVNLSGNIKHHWIKPKLKANE